MDRFNKIKRVWEKYGLIRKLSSINGPNVNKRLLDRVMYNFEELPPLGKEYWWFLFFGRDGKKPVQFMLLIFRKYGKRMFFNNKEMKLEKLGKNKFRVVTSGWIYDGEKLRDFGDTNAVVEVQKEKIVSDFSGRKMVLSGGFPNYRLNLDGIMDLRIRESDYLEKKNAQGIFLPPFGIGWIDIFSSVNGKVLGKKFNGTVHLQKVIGITTPGHFHWGRLVFQKGSSVSFFCLRIKKGSEIYFHKSVTFHDNENMEIIRFDNPKLKISKKKRNFIIEANDGEKNLRIVLETYAKKRYNMKGGGSQVYIEYAVVPKEFTLKTGGREISLDNLGKGVGTFEDALGKLL